MLDRVFPQGYITSSTGNTSLCSEATLDYTHFQSYTAKMEDLFGNRQTMTAFTCRNPSSDKAAYSNL